MRARLYVGAAGIDPGFTDEQRRRLDESLRAAGVRYEIEVYEGAQHGFAVHHHRVYDRTASATKFFVPSASVAAGPA